MSSQSSERPLAQMAAAQHHMRSSPPIQPGEQNHAAKLPSFSEFLHTTRAVTPPRTPSHRNESVENSPRARPFFDEVAWNADYPRRRHDTLGDIYAPSMHTYHQKSPIASIRPSYAQPSAVHGLASSAAHRRPSSRSDAIYEQPRPNYYQDTHAPSYLYDRAQDYNYAGPSNHGPAHHGPAHPGYEVPYGDIRFQQHVGLDHNSFNRKRRGNLPKESTNLLKEWFAANRASPYPTEDQKLQLCHRANLSINQVSNWFINARRRAPQKEQRERQANEPSASTDARPRPAS
ncbi:hypothetical protein T440DRAFT_522048 [Plenodomus tracheiphilus IPT5]|uniref:Homeobox domain-containing protein n=1 Tax=Plenodomus tracheiphilus IPT5 TaxID=1408161 RepID=A0A6A7ASR6_9PLEO|nr:hypothetical protein T440DRAFT_522048 [Plenodomus tracheiphilus IPT5]